MITRLNEVGTANLREAARAYRTARKAALEAVERDPRSPAALDAVQREKQVAQSVLRMLERWGADE